MDNKKWYKRISTCFWFLLATLPWWLCVLQTLFTFLIHLDNITDISDINSFFNSHNFSVYVSNITTFLWNICPSFLTSIFQTIFTDIGSSSSWLPLFCGWFCWVYFIELMVDFVVWLPRLCHSFMERWCHD